MKDFISLSPLFGRFRSGFTIFLLHFLRFALLLRCCIFASDLIFLRMFPSILIFNWNGSEATPYRCVTALAHISCSPFLWLSSIVLTFRFVFFSFITFYPIYSCFCCILATKIFITFFRMFHGRFGISAFIGWFVFQEYMWVSHLSDICARRRVLSHSERNKKKSNREKEEKI